MNGRNRLHIDETLGIMALIVGFFALWFGSLNWFCSLIIKGVSTDYISLAAGVSGGLAMLVGYILCKICEAREKELEDEKEQNKIEEADYYWY